MVHVAMQEALDGKHVEWLEHVTDEQYAKAPGAPEVAIAFCGPDRAFYGPLTGW